MYARPFPTLVLFLTASCGSEPAAPRLVAGTRDLARTTFAPALAAPFDPALNTFWCASLPLAWAELETVARGPIRTDGENATVEWLNGSPVTRDDVRNAAVVARAGRIQDGVVDGIQAEVRRAFGEDDPTLAAWAARDDVALIAYARLERALSFARAFDDLEGEPLEFHYALEGEARTQRVDAFGIVTYAPGDDRDQARARQVEVLHYVDDTDFVVRLVAEGATDRLLVARLAPGETLAATWSAVAERAFGPGASPGGLRSGESLIVPEIDFVLEHRFSELEGVRVMNDGPPGMPIAGVMQDLRLRLDEEGVVVRSRAIVAVLGAAVAEKPRRFVCDGPFLVALIEEGAQSPWLLAWITDPEVLIAE